MAPLKFSSSIMSRNLRGISSGRTIRRHRAVIAISLKTAHLRNRQISLGWLVAKSVCIPAGFHFDDCRVYQTWTLFVATIRDANERPLRIPIRHADSFGLFAVNKSKGRQEGKC